MSLDFHNLLSMEFLPLSEAKAKLSEQVRKLVAEGKRLAITTNGRPTAVMLSYGDYLELLRKTAPSDAQSPFKVIDFDQWQKEARKRKMISDSISRLFDVSKLSRKGQKSYKKEKVREFQRKS